MLLCFIEKLALKLDYGSPFCRQTHVFRYVQGQEFNLTLWQEEESEHNNFKKIINFILFLKTFAKV